ncbi:uncharacterized protein QC763_701650 [Podospora pseudopauciseta]|uniref:Uncharacterized protein n=1 Tax=Podospora pseudopauciseta TaxID=2093780 RepID=A0ABR0H0L2_9PEZI|nr:hypothetical protein QC763_701650 [Podospora pseudopauciseta]
MMMTGRQVAPQERALTARLGAAWQNPPKNWRRWLAESCPSTCDTTSPVHNLDDLELISEIHISIEGQNAQRSRTISQREAVCPASPPRQRPPRRPRARTIPALGAHLWRPTWRRRRHTRQDESPRQSLSRTNSPLRRPPPRRHLQHRNRALPHDLPRLRSQPPDRDRSPHLPPPRKDGPPLRRPRYRVSLPRRRPKVLVHPRRRPRPLPRRQPHRRRLLRRRRRPPPLPQAGHQHGGRRLDRLHPRREGAGAPQLAALAVLRHVELLWGGGGCRRFGCDVDGGAGQVGELHHQSEQAWRDLSDCKAGRGAGGGGQFAAMHKRCVGKGKGHVVKTGQVVGRGCEEEG